MKANDVNEVSFQFWPFRIVVRGRIAIYVIGPAIVMILLVIAWRLAIGL